MPEFHSFLNSSIYLKDKNFNLPDIVNSFFVKSETIISIWSIYQKFDVVSNTKKSSWKKKTFKLEKCKFVSAASRKLKKVYKRLKRSR